MKITAILLSVLLSAIGLVRCGGLRRLQDQFQEETINPESWDAGNPSLEDDPWSEPGVPVIEDVPVEPQGGQNVVAENSEAAPEYEQNKYENQGVDIDQPVTSGTDEYFYQSVPFNYEPHPAANDFDSFYDESWLDNVYIENDPLSQPPTGYEFGEPAYTNYYQEPYIDYYETEPYAMPIPMDHQEPYVDYYETDPYAMPIPIEGEFNPVDYGLYPQDYPLEPEPFPNDMFAEPEVDYEFYVRQSEFGPLDEDYWAEYDPVVEAPGEADYDEYDPFVEPVAEQPVDYNIAAAEVDRHARGVPQSRPLSNFRPSP